MSVSEIEEEYLHLPTTVMEKFQYSIITQADIFDFVQWY